MVRAAAISSARPTLLSFLASNKNWHLIVGPWRLGDGAICQRTNCLADCFSILGAVICTFSNSRQLDECMLRNFKRDHSLFRRKSARWLQNAQVVKSGSMALILDVDLDTLSANYANLGDCRLVIRDFSLEGSRVFSLQTEDMNMNTAAERERLIREHPNENQMIIANRLFGRLISTRGALSIASLLTMTGIGVPSSSLLLLQALATGIISYQTEF